MSMADDAMSGLNTARRLSYGEQLARAARKSPDERALRFEDRELTFGELDDRVTRLANALAERGASKGDRVATLTYNGLEMVEKIGRASCRERVEGVGV